MTCFELSKQVGRYMIGEIHFCFATKLPAPKENSAMPTLTDIGLNGGDIGFNTLYVHSQTITIGQNVHQNSYLKVKTILVIYSIHYVLFTVQVSNNQSILLVI